MSVATSPHPAPDILAAFGRGALPPDERAAIETHVAVCGTCCSALAALSDDRLAGLAREAAATQAPTSDSLLVPDVPTELVDHPRYQILGQLGAGGMGVVYKAEHKLMGRTVALKVIGRRYTSNPKAMERFRREFRAAAKLDHANIVRAYDADEANGLHFLVMEYVEGVSLDRLVRRRGPLAIATACQCIRQAALGLQHAHEQGMVHRDIKPHNLMVTRKGQVKVLDFGLARLAEVAESDSLIPGDGPPNQSTGVTTPSLVIGTPDYLAPEQAKNAHTVDIRADVYALGCVLYYLLTGRPPFAAIGAPLEKLFAHVENEPDPVRKVRPEVPTEVESILNRMMAKDPADRFTTPGEAAAALKPYTRADGLIDDQPEIVEPPPLPAPAVSTAAIAGAPTEAITRPAVKRPKRKLRPRSRRPWPFITAGVLAIAVLGGLVAYIAFLGKDQDRGKDGGTSTGSSSSPGGLVAGKRVLFVVPHENLHVPDYRPVVQRLTAAGVQVDTASTATTECRGYKGERTRVVPKYLVTDVKSSDYAGVLFCGADVSEYVRDPSSAAYKAVERIIREMTAERKVVAAICVGQNVLFRFKVIPALQPGVITKDCVVTAKDPDTEWSQFADAVLAALTK